MLYLLSISTLTLLCVILGYTWILYPFVMLLLHGRMCKPNARSHETTLHQHPHVSIIIAAWNEENIITARLQNIEALDYPHDCISVFIGTDGCTDGTAEQVRAYRAHSHLNLALQEFPDNRGKASVLVDLVQLAAETQPSTGTILVFSDANTFFQKDAITHLIRRLAPPDVGGVCGRLIFEQDHNQPEKNYWSLETKLKEVEAYYDSCLGANGAIYALRVSSFWQQLPPQTIIDDFVLGMKVRETGLRMVFEPQAIACEDLPAPSAEWTRRVRIGSGAYQAMVQCRTCLHPRYGKFAFFFWSHKILRWISPHLLLAAIIMAVLSLMRRPHFSLPSALLPVGILAASSLLLATLPLHRLLSFTPTNRLQHAVGNARHFLLMQAALMAGFVRFCRGNLAGTWQRTPRSTTRETET